METIEEAARKNCEFNEFSLRQFDKHFIECFKDGVEFAQRWIPVEEELPKTEDKYLVIRNGNIEIELWKVTNDKGYWYDYLGITHWRLIELK